MSNIQNIQQMIENGQSQRALVKLKKMAAKNSQNPEIHRLLGVIYLQQNTWPLAEKHLQHAHQLKPNFGPTLLNLASLYKAQKKYSQAHQCYQQLLNQGVTNAPLYYNLANLYRDQNEISQAESAYLACLKLQPNHLGALVAFGFLMKNTGRIDQAIDYFHQALAINPYQHDIYWALANLKQYRFNDHELATLNQMIAQAGDRVPPELLFAKAYALEHAGEYDAAFAQLEQANRLRYRQLQRKPFDWSGLTQAIQRVFNPEFIKAHTVNAHSNTKQPVFIVSMPRSGSTLTEQILASHSAVYGASELPYFPNIMTVRGRENNNSYPESLASMKKDDFADIAGEYFNAVGTDFKETIFTDKQPLNFNFVGAILMAIPNAKVIHCTRQDLAVLLSCYKQLFAHGHEYSYDIEELVANYQHQVNIMAYWKNCFPDKIYALSYEDMVQDTRLEIERLLSFLKLDWQDTCLQFYHTKRHIKTASAGQVTQKIYDTSVHLHKKYQNSMAKFENLLKNN